MKVQVLQENLNKGLTIASRSIAAKAQLPVLANILIKSDDGRLTVSATNLETSVKMWLGAKIEEDGEVTVPAKLIGEVVASLVPGKVDLVTKGVNLDLATNNYNASFNGMAATEFPQLPDFDDKQLLDVPVDKLTELITQTVFSAATDEGRPVLTGVLLKTSGNSLLTVATDGYRLSKKVLMLEKALPDLQMLVPAKTLVEIGRIISEQKTETVKIGFTKEKNQVVFVFPDLVLFSRVIEGEFPDYGRIIPQGFQTKVVVDKESLARAVKLVSIFARDSANVIKVKIGQAGIEMSANSPQVGENKDTIEAKVEGDGLETAFNFRFLQGFLAATGGSMVVIELGEALSPAVFKIEGDETLLHIIMPVRLQSENRG